MNSMKEYEIIKYLIFHFQKIQLNTCNFKSILIICYLIKFLKINFYISLRFYVEMLSILIELAILNDLGDLKLARLYTLMI